MKLDISEFTYGTVGPISGKDNTKSLKERLISRIVFVKDNITNMEKKYTIPNGRYSKDKLQDLRANAILMLMEDLYSKRNNLK